MFLTSLKSKVSDVTAFHVELFTYSNFKTSLSYPLDNVKWRLQQDEFLSGGGGGLKRAFSFFGPSGFSFLLWSHKAGKNILKSQERFLMNDH